MYPSQSTVLGTYLDPLADKFLVFGLGFTLSGLGAGLLPTLPVVAWALRDVLLVGGAYVHVSHATPGGHAGNGIGGIMDPATTPLKVEPSVMSRANTVLQFGTIVLALAVPLVAGGEAAGGAEVAEAVLRETAPSSGNVHGTLPLQETVNFLAWFSVLTTAASGYGYYGGASLTNSKNAPQKEEATRVSTPDVSRDTHLTSPIRKS
mmetsp:Transcript_26973/g.53880  ORF Transcript_26973/g.53880 Transcript_26973/m.53880 type:complete len:206 (+) Transcript_26973:164-781(+)